MLIDSLFRAIRQDEGELTDSDDAVNIGALGFWQIGGGNENAERADDYWLGEGDSDIFCRGVLDFTDGLIEPEDSFGAE